MSQRHALGLLFLALAAAFAVIAYSAGREGVWPVTLAALVLGGWMLTMSLRLLGKRSR
jgi:hypothetical protein